MSLNITKRISCWCAMVLSCALLVACFETEQEFTLNPDGSGKMELDAIFPNITMNGDQDLSDKELQKAVGDFLKKVQGIEAWRDVSYAWTDDARIHFKGTGYFTDIEKVDLDNISMMSFAWEGDGDTRTLVMAMKDDGDGQDPEAEVSKDPEERAKQIKQERARFQQTKPMMEGMLGTMKQSAVFHLPGEAGETSNFTAESDGKVSLQLTGAKMIAAMETLVNDDEWMAENAFDAQKGPSDGGAILAAMFGNKKPVEAKRVSVEKPLFDYAAELAAARVEFEKLQEQLGPKIAPAAKGEPFKSLQVGGVRFVKKVSDDMNLRPFNYDAGFTLSLFAEFSGSVLEMTDNSKLEKAIADDGSDLLPEREYDRKIQFPRLSDDRSAVIFEVDLLTPGESVKSIREVSGTVQYVVSSNTKEIDLGFSSVKVGESGKELDAKITKIEDGWKDDESKNIEIELSVEKEMLKELVMVDGSSRTVMERRGYSSFGSGSTTYTFEAEGGIPEGAKLFAVIHDGIQTYDIPFKLENISLLGEPMGE